MIVVMSRTYAVPVALMALKHLCYISHRLRTKKDKEGSLHHDAGAGGGQGYICMQ
jgi:hypothetical protein